MKIRRVVANNRKDEFEVTMGRRILSFPYRKADPAPTNKKSVQKVFVDPELGNEGFTYILSSGEEGSVHGDYVLDYNKDPDYLKKIYLYTLTLAAKKRLRELRVGVRELARKLNTTPTQVYRLLDQTNYSKTIDSMLRLLSALDIEVEMIVKKSADRPSDMPRKSKKKHQATRAN